jgi:serine/threonine-protein phosphatase CPPED1
MRRLLLSLAVLLVPWLAGASEPWFFIVLSDPQFGMFAKDKNFVQETANFEFAVATVNRLHPRFVVVCGDLVNKPGDPGQIAEYQRILAKVDREIPVYSVPGNHDVGNSPTTATVNEYRQKIGADHYTFVAGNLLGIVLDSSLIRDPQQAREAAAEQERWLQETLAKAKRSGSQVPVVFQHIPYFLKEAAEADEYFNIPSKQRRGFLDLLEASGVKYIFAGHLHRSLVAREGALLETVTGPVGMPLGGSESGFRAVKVQDGELTSQWFSLGAIPNTINLQSSGFSANRASASSTR